MGTTTVRRPNTLRVDLGAISHNLAEVRRIAGSGVGIVAALKADAYGFGLERVAETVVAGGADMIALADIADALRLRARGVETPVLLYAGNLADRSAVEAVAAHRLMPTILDRESAESYSTCAKQTVRVFIKIDVGLERLGVLPGQAAELARQVRALPNLELHGVYTHVDVPESPRAEEYVAWQLERYRATCMEIEGEGAVPVKMAASSAVLRCDPGAAFDAVDPGHILFGLTPPGPLNVAAELRPAFVSLTSRIIHAERSSASTFSMSHRFPAQGHALRGAPDRPARRNGRTQLRRSAGGRTARAHPRSPLPGTYPGGPERGSGSEGGRRSGDHGAPGRRCNRGRKKSSRTRASA